MSAERAASAEARSALADRGDAGWSVAAAASLDRFSVLVTERSRAIADGAGTEEIHDLRTATRRLRTAIEIYGADAPGRDRRRAERELRRLVHRLGAVRDLDVLLDALDAARTSDGRLIARRTLRPLRRAWKRERRSEARRLERVIRGRRLGRSLERIPRLADADRHDPDPGSEPVERISTRAPGVIWDAFGTLLSFDIAVRDADPAAIHRMRIAAKKLRYALEGFQDALEPGAALVAQVTALQDAAGEMHDAVVAADRARSTVRRAGLRRSRRAAIDAFADAQERRAEQLRPAIARHLAAVRSREFRASVSRAVAAMGHVDPDR